MYSLLPLFADCVDKSNKCAKFAKYCKNHGKVQNNCKATCNICGKLKIISTCTERSDSFIGYKQMRFLHNKNPFFFLLANGNWGEWGSYGSCSVSCGDGTKSRTRSCSNPTPFGGGSDCSGSSSESVSCNNGACPGKEKIFQYVNLYIQS